MPMILVKKNPRGKVIRELSSEEETAVKMVCGLKKPATMAQHNLANDLLREMREYDAWLQCDCIPGDSPAMNFAALKNNTGTLYLSSFNHEHAPECPMYRQLSGNEEETSFGAVNATMFDRYLPFSCPLNTFVTDAVRFAPFHHH